MVLITLTPDVECFCIFTRSPPLSQFGFKLIFIWPRRRTAVALTNEARSSVARMMTVLLTDLVEVFCPAGNTARYRPRSKEILALSLVPRVRTF